MLCIVNVINFACLQLKTLYNHNQLLSSFLQISSKAESFKRQFSVHLWILLIAIFIVDPQITASNISQNESSGDCTQSEMCLFKESSSLLFLLC